MSNQPILTSITGALPRLSRGKGDKASASLKRRAAEGSLWVLSTQGIGVVVRTGSRIVLAWLLFPQAFGLMLLVNTLMKGLKMLSDVGIRANMIQSDHSDDPDFYNTAWTLQIVRGVVLWAIATALAWPYAWLMDKPTLMWLVPVTALTAVFAGLGSTLRFTLDRDMAYARTSILQVSTHIVSVGITIYWAWLMPSVWALVGGGVIGTCLSTAASHFLVPGKRNRLAWHPEHARTMIKFGAWILISTALTFAALEADKFILGALLDKSFLGVVSVALGFVSMPRDLMESFRRRVMLPAFSQRKHHPRDDVRRKLRRIRMPIILLGAVGMAAGVSVADYVVRGLLDDRYIQAAWILPILTLGLWPRILFGMTPPMVALGKPQYNAYGSGLRFVAVAAGLPLAYMAAGLPGAIILIACADVPIYLVVLVALFRERLTCFWQDVLATGVMVSMLMLLLAGRQMLGYGSPFALMPGFGAG